MGSGTADGLEIANDTFVCLALVATSKSFFIKKSV